MVTVKSVVLVLFVIWAIANLAFGFEYNNFVAIALLFLIGYNTSKG